MKTILLVDDKKNVREYCRDVLQEEGFRVILAANGFEALKAIRRETPDLVILDLCMPRMTGWYILPRLKTVNPNVPVILFTAQDEDCLEDPRSDLATACVEKNADLTELIRTIDCVFRSKSSGDGIDVWRYGLPPRRRPAAALGTVRG